ncbi:MAG: hypothetical protein ACTIMT_05355 [Marinomonadaceae bacterium]
MGSAVITFGFGYVWIPSAGAILSLFAIILVGISRLIAKNTRVSL